MTTPPPSEADEDPDADFPTEVVDRAVPSDEDADADFPTEVVDRSFPADADADADFPTEVVDRPVPADEDPDADFPTEVVDRSAPAPVPARAPADTAAPAPRPSSLRGRRTARRRGITFPPMEPGARTGVPAVGPGAVASYPVRELPVIPDPPDVVESGPAATRAPAPSMPSVVRRSRSIGRLTLVLVAASVLVSAVGLTLIASLVFG